VQTYFVILLVQADFPYCLYHHERYDGKGYPYGLKGKDIPPEGRLIAVADTLDALTSNRLIEKD
jgi:HD-GYP domain-containing protein (c-di-GMP phosphodiesterase class II)